MVGPGVLPRAIDAEGWALVEDWLPANVIEKA